MQGHGSEVTVRVRGPYATALTKLLIDEGFRIVQASRVISERMGIEGLCEAAKVTVKSSEEDPGSLLVVGEAGAFEEVFEALKRRLQFSFYNKSILQQYSTIMVRVKGVVNEKCIADAGGIEVELETNRCVEGEVKPACIVRAPTGEMRPKAREGFCVLTDTLVLSTSGRTSFSRHIKSAERVAELENLSLSLRQQGLSVRWRSNAGVTSLNKVLEDLDEAKKKLKELEQESEGKPPGTLLSPGEYIALVHPSLPDKLLLDRLRMLVTNTILYHHTLKTMGSPYDSIVEFSEKLVKEGFKEDFLGKKAFEYAWQKLSDASRVTILHRYPEGNLIRIGPARVIEADNKILLERTVKTQGTYDGLGETKEPGDKILTLIIPGCWSLAHIYLSRERALKGVYFNVNTPPEPGPSKIYYLDLHVDVVFKPGSGVSIIDRENLEVSYSKGLLGESLYKKALEVSKKLEDSIIESLAGEQPERVSINVLLEEVLNVLNNVSNKRQE